MSQGRFYSLHTHIQIYSLHTNRLLDLVCGYILYDKSESENFQNKLEQEVQGLQALAFSVVTVNDKLRKPRFKIKQT